MSDETAEFRRPADGTPPTNRADTTSDVDTPSNAAEPPGGPHAPESPQASNDPQTPEGPQAAGGPPPGGTPPPAAPPPPPPGPPPPGPSTPGPPPPGSGYDRPGDTPFAWRYGLVRPREGRYLAGVCAAIGRATNTDPVLWRVLFAVLGFFGGLGILVYFAAWLIIPAEGDNASPIESMLGRGRSSMSPLTVILLGVLAVVIFAFIVSRDFSAVLLGTAILIGGALLLSREAGRRRAAPGAAGAADEAAAAFPPHPTPAPAESGYPASGPPAYPTPPTPAAGSTGAYRPPFAPYGPYGSGASYPPPAAAAAPQPPKPPRERSPLGAATFSMIFVVIGLIALLDLANVLPIGPSAYFAGVLVTIALGLLVGAWFGRARWLIALGIAATVALGISTLAESSGPEELRSGSVVWRPTTIDDLAERYENNFGDATLDLSSVDLRGGEPNLTVQVNFGRLVVIVPADADVTAVSDVNAGDATVFGERWSGVHGSAREVTDLGPDGPGGGKLRLDLHVTAGELEVRR